VGRADEGVEEMDKALVEFICDAARAEMFAELLARAARTGRRGDGIVSVHPALSVVKIRREGV
jgi:nitrogen regulatory protein PII